MAKKAKAEELVLDGSVTLAWYFRDLQAQGPHRLVLSFIHCSEKMPFGRRVRSPAQ
jgi:hypothetical protein